MSEEAVTQQTDGGAQGDTGNAGASAGVATSWLDTLPDDLKSNDDLKGFKDPGEVAKAFLDTKGKLQAPPESPEGYQVEIPQGIPVDEAFVADAKAWAHKAGLSDAQFKAFAAPYVEAQRQAIQRSMQADQDGIAELKKEWGDKFDENAVIAREAVKRFAGEGFGKFLDDTRLGNNPMLIKAFLKIGKAISSDKLIEGDGGHVPGLKLTPHGTPIMADYPEMRK